MSYQHWLAPMQDTTSAVNPHAFGKRCIWRWAHFELSRLCKHSRNMRIGYACFYASDESIFVPRCTKTLHTVRRTPPLCKCPQVILILMDTPQIPRRGNTRRDRLLILGFSRPQITYLRRPRLALQYPKYPSWIISNQTLHRPRQTRDSLAQVIPVTTRRWQPTLLVQILPDTPTYNLRLQDFPPTLPDPCALHG